MRYRGTGEAIPGKITSTISSLGLDMSFCRAQGYDGAGNMAGKCIGAATRIQEKYPKAIYVHCASHILNLCVASSCKIQVVQNMMNTVRVVSDFFNNSPKRFDLITKKIKESYPRVSHTKLTDVCCTCWLARIDGLEIFIELFVAVVKSLEVIKDNAGLSYVATDTNTIFRKKSCIYEWILLFSG